MIFYALVALVACPAVLGQQNPGLNGFLNQFNQITGKNEPGANTLSPEVRISGGNEVNPKFKYPFMAFLRLDGYTDQQYLCGATLLDDKTLLTSAHCVTADFKDLFTAHTHRHNKRLSAKSEKGGIHRFANVLPHEKFYTSDAGVPFNDIALVRLKTPVRGVTNFVRLPPKSLGDPPSDVDLTIVGWGLTKPKGSQSDVLEHAEKLHLTYNCYTKGSGLNKSQHLCGLGKISADACANDFGGPLLAPATDDGYIQVGIVSASAKCGATGKPGIYTRVLGHTAWIASSMRKL